PGRGTSSRIFPRRSARYGPGRSGRRGPAAGDGGSWRPPDYRCNPGRGDLRDGRASSLPSARLKMRGMSIREPANAPGFAARLAALAPGLEVLGMPVYVVDSTLCYRYVNAAYELHAGRKASELLGFNLLDLYPIPPDD